MPAAAGCAAYSPSRAASSTPGSSGCCGRSGGSTGAHRPSCARRTTRDLTTYGEFLEREGFSGYFIAHYAVPVVSCVWSAGRETTLVYPARYLFRFLDHHGLLRVGGSPQWYSIAGGSRVYVERLAGLLQDVRAAHAVTGVTRRADGVEIRDVTGQVTRVDRVVIATHADQALGLLADPSDAEVTTLKQFGYSANVTVLHTDSSVLPDAAQARASWNYRMTSCDRPGQPAVVTYWMNRLQGHRSPRGLPRHAQRPRASRPALRCRGHGLRAPGLHARGGPGAVAARRPRHRSHGLCRGLPRLGLPRGRLPLRRRGRPALRGDLVSAGPADDRPGDDRAGTRTDPAARAASARHRPGHAPAPRTGPPCLPAPRLPVAHRPRLGPQAALDTSGRSRTSAARITSATPA